MRGNVSTCGRVDVYVDTSLRPYVHTSPLVPLTPRAPSADNNGMDDNHLMVSLLFGTIGLAMFVYGKKAGRMVALGAGVGLMVVPYFISNVLAMSGVCVGMMVM